MSKVKSVPELPREQWPASFEEACQRKGYDAEAVVKAFSLLPLPEPHKKALLAEAMLIVIIEVLNNGWIPDWANGLWDKWVVWFRMDESPSGGGFSLGGVDHWYSCSYVGARLVFRDEKTARYAGTRFVDLYRDFMVLENETKLMCNDE